MTDELAGLVEETAPAEETPPAAPEVDIETRFQQMESQLNERIKGFQRVVAEKDQALAAARQEAKELRMSQMSQEEKDAAEWEDVQRENAELKTQLGLLQLGTEYPKELPIFQQIVQAATPKDQLELIRQLVNAQTAQASASTPPQEPPAEGEPAIPPVDPNNAPRRPLNAPNVGTFNGVPITEQWADEVLARLSGR